MKKSKDYTLILLIIIFLAALFISSCTTQRTCPQAYPKKKSQLVTNNRF